MLTFTSNILQGAKTWLEIFENFSQTKKKKETRHEQTLAKITKLDDRPITPFAKTVFLKSSQADWLTKENLNTRDIFQIALIYLFMEKHPLWIAAEKVLKN